MFTDGELGSSGTCSSPMAQNEQVSPFTAATRPGRIPSCWFSHLASSVSLGSGVLAEPSSPTGVASGCPLRRGSGGRCVVPVEVSSEPSPAVVRIKGRFRCCWGLRRGRLPGVGPLPERSLARVDERCRLRRGTFGWGQRDQGSTEVDGRQPAVRVAGCCADAIVRAARDARLPRDHCDFDPVGQMNGRAELLAVLVREEHGTPTAIRRVDEDPLSDCDGGRRGRPGDRAATGTEGCQGTSSGKCARGARRHARLRRELHSPCFSRRRQTHGIAQSRRRWRLLDARCRS